jgi:hypothetical protein
MVALAFVCASPAWASLGGQRGTLEVDRAHLAARLDSTYTSAWAVHVLTLANGAVVREFMRSDGMIFAVAWRGPSRPDLRQLLGPRFDTFQNETAIPGGRRARRPLSVRRTDLVVHSGGHPGGFSGYAYMPQLTPVGFSARDPG